MAQRHDLLPADIVQRPKFGGSIAPRWLEESANFRRFAAEVVLDPAGWTSALGLRGAMEDFFLRGRASYAFPHPLSILSIVAWRLLMLNLWAAHYLRRGSRG